LAGGFYEKLFRTESGLLQSILAELVGVDVNYVIKWERYEECPNSKLVSLLDQNIKRKYLPKTALKYSIKSLLT